MAVDSIIARPTNSVRVMVAEASGCCARDVRAVATARPSASAGPIVPNPVVRPATAIEITAIHVMLSMVCPSSVWNGFGFRRWLGFGRARGSRDVNRGEDAENVGLHHAGEQTESGHHDRKDEGRYGEQNAD